MKARREIKSFVKRQRRIAPRLQAAYDSVWPKYGVALDNTPLDLNVLFGHHAPTICEIGFGHGDTLLPMAINNPHYNYLGIEVHKPGIAAVMMGIVENNITNIRIIQHDAVAVLTHFIQNDAFSRIHIYFPDPWPKKKHKKRRIIQPDFVVLLRQKLKNGGILHCATDWEDYAIHMMSVLSQASGFKNSIGENQFADNATLHLRANTKFEKRGVKLGHNVWDLLFA